MKTAGKRDQYIAQAKCLRGIYAYYLASIYKDPSFYIDADLTADQLINKTNTPQEAIFTQACLDLTEALAVLPSKTEQSNSDIGRVNKATCAAFLGKSYLFRHNWDSASIWFKKIIDQEYGTYKLIMPQGTDSLDLIYAYMCNFTWTDLNNNGKIYKAENNDESIFEIQNAKNVPANTWNALLPGYGSDGSLFTSWFQLYPTGYNNIGVRNTFVAKYDTALSTLSPLQYDARRYASVYWGTNDTVRCSPSRTNLAKYATFCDKPGQAKSGITSQGATALKKYLYPVYPYNASEDKEGDPTNWRLVRYSDILLMYAEAQLQLNNSAEALTRINEVRARAGVAPATGDAKTALMHEREIELGLEGSLMLDVMRWSTTDYGDKFIDPRTVKSQFIVGKHEYFPIPQSEVDIMVNLVQHSGW